MLDRNIIRALVKKGDIYESVRHYGNNKEAHNAVFLGRDDTGTPRNGFQRGLVSFSGGTAFKRDVAGSDPSWPFVLAGRPGVTTVMVFEGAIDAISHATLYKLVGMDHTSCDRIALGGTQKGIGLLNYLEHHPKIKQVILSMDADDAGKAAMQKMKELIPTGKYIVSTSTPPEGKDWNDYLKLRSKKT